MPPSSLILIGALTPSAGILGSLVWPMVQRRAGWSNLRVLVVLVAMASAIPAYGCLGFLPVFQRGSVKFGGLTTPAEMYVLAVYFVSRFLWENGVGELTLECVGFGVRQIGRAHV